MPAPWERRKTMNRQPMKVDAELIHNWSQRYIHVRTGQLGELSQDIRADLLRAHMAHHRDGRNAQELAEEVAAKHPGLLYA